MWKTFDSDGAVPSRRCWHAAVVATVPGWLLEAAPAREAAPAEPAEEEVKTPAAGKGKGKGKGKAPEEAAAPVFGEYPAPPPTPRSRGLLLSWRCWALLLIHRVLPPAAVVVLRPTCGHGC